MKRGLMVAVLSAAVGLILPPEMRATTLRPPTFEELVRRADVVVRGEVTAVRCEWKGAAAERRIVTKVTVRVDERIVGEPAGMAVEAGAGAAGGAGGTNTGPATTTIELELLGGKIGDDALTVAGMPEFKVGDRDILFVENNGRQLCPLVTMGHGRYLVSESVPGAGVAGAEIVTRADGVPLASVDEVALPLLAPAAAGRVAAMKRDPLTPAEFAERVRAEARRQGRNDVAGGEQLK